MILFFNILIQCAFHQALLQQFVECSQLNNLLLFRWVKLSSQDLSLLKTPVGEATLSLLGDCGIVSANSLLLY